jgi:hypothetical protein
MTFLTSQIFLSNINIDFEPGNLAGRRYDKFYGNIFDTATMHGVMIKKAVIIAVSCGFHLGHIFEKTNPDFSINTPQKQTNTSWNRAQEKKGST